MNRVASVRRHCRLLTLLIALVCACSGDDVPPQACSDEASEIRCELGVPFVVRGDRELLYDLYRPAAQQAPAPLVILVHGGFWFRGSRESQGGLGQELAGRGYVAAAIDYRLISPETFFPDPLADVIAAVRHFRQHAEDRDIDPQRIALWAASAGAHLALLAGMTADTSLFDAEALAGESAGVKAIVALSPPTDFTVEPLPLSQWQRVLIEALLGPSAGEASEDLRFSASPINHVRRDGPTILLVHGTLDNFVPVSQSRRLHAALEAVGQPSVYIEILGMNHLNTSMWPSRIYLPQMLDFLDGELHPDGGAADSDDRASEAVQQQEQQLQRPQHDRDQEFDGAGDPDAGVDE